MLFLVLSALLALRLDAAPIPGDIDGDGNVGFPDFVILAQNFGKTGDPGGPLYPCPSETIYVQPAIPSADSDIPGLAAITVSAVTANYDADPEDDGWALTIQLRDQLATALYPGRTINTRVDYAVAVTLTATNRDKSRYYPESAQRDTLRRSAPITVNAYGVGRFIIARELVIASVNSLLPKVVAWVDSTALARAEGGLIIADFYRGEYDIETIDPQQSELGRIPVTATLSTATRKYLGTTTLKWELGYPSARVSGVP